MSQKHTDYIFDDSVAVTTDRDSTNVLYVGNANESAGNPLLIQITVTETFATTVSVVFSVLDSADDSTFGQPAIVATGAIAVATLVKGYRIQLTVPPTHKAYLKITYDVSTSATAGKVFSEILPAKRFGYP